MKVVSVSAVSLVVCVSAVVLLMWRRDSFGYLDLVYFHGVAEPSKRGYPVIPRRSLLSNSRGRE